MVFATATGTAVFGNLIDLGYSINAIAAFSAIYIATIVLFLLANDTPIHPETAHPIPPLAKP